MIMIYDVTMRTIIDITDEQALALAILCEQEKLSRAEVIRRAISMYVQAHPTPVKDEAFGLWKKKKRDALAYQEQLRGEWPS